MWYSSARSQRVAEREAFQEIDYRRMYGQMASGWRQIDRVERIPEYVSRAFHTRRRAGRPRWCSRFPRTPVSAGAVADVPRHHSRCGVASPAEVSSLRELLFEGAEDLTF